MFRRPVRVVAVTAAISIVCVCSASLAFAQTQSEHRAADKSGNECGRVTRSYKTLDPNYIGFEVVNNCSKAILIEGKIGEALISTTVAPGQTREVGCLRRSTDCGTGKIDYTIRWN